MPDPPMPPPRTWQHRQRWRAALGGTAGFTAVLLPGHVFAGFMLLFAVGNNDDSGSGGPFRSCTPDSVSCSGPAYGMIAMIMLYVLGTSLAAASFGREKGGLPRRNLLHLGAFSAALGAVGAVLLGLIMI